METETSSPVLVAKILKPHGLTGEVVLHSYTDVKGRLEELRTYLLIDEGRIIGELKVEAIRFFGGRYVLKFHGISSRTEAEKLRNKELAIPESEIGTLPADYYFIHQLVGMKVQLRNGQPIGNVTNFIQTGGVDLLEVEGEHLVPFASDICVEVDLGKGLIVIDPPEGLLQLNAH